jgi:hypothetical protein
VSVAVTQASAPASQAPALSQLRSRFTLNTMPGRLRLLLVTLVVASLAWGALLGFTVSQYSSAASGVLSTSEPLTLDAQHIYHDLSDANDTEATAVLTGGPESLALRSRYLSDIHAAAAAIEAASSMGGTATGTSPADLATLSTGLPVYTGEIESARADNRVGYPLGAAYLREATTLMDGSLLPAAQRLYTTENSGLTGTSAQATGLPLVLITIVIGLVLGYALYRTSRWLTARTNRVLNGGLTAAGAAALIAIVWLAVAYAGARSDLLTAQARGSVPVEALARADIAALQAHADESLTLIDNTGDDNFQTDYTRREADLRSGQNLLAAAGNAAVGSPGAGAVTAAITHARAWFTAHSALRAQDDNGNHPAAVASALGSGPGTAGGQFTAFSASMNSGINADQAAFGGSARDGANMYGGLEAAVIVATLLMAAGCAWGLSRRLVEYR